MTLPASGSISLGQVLDELRVANSNRGLPISLGDADVLALAGKSGPPISLGDLYGKSAIAPLTAVGNNDYTFTNSSAANGTARAYPSVTVSGGSGARTYAWSILSTNNASATLSNTGNIGCTVSVPYYQNTNGSATVYLRCVVTDSTGSVTVDNIVARMDWEGNR